MTNLSPSLYPQRTFEQRIKHAPEVPYIGKPGSAKKVGTAAVLALIAGTAIGLATGAQSASYTPEWGFHMTPGAEEGATTYTFNNGGTINVLQNAEGMPAIEWQGLEGVGEFSSWIADFGYYEAFGEWLTFDFHIEKHLGNCTTPGDAKVTYFGLGADPREYFDALEWIGGDVNGNVCASSGGGYVTTYTEVAAVPLPASVWLMLAALGGLAVRRAV